MSKRIQRKRIKGWRAPAGAIYVGRGSRWGNPFKVSVLCCASHAVQLYEEWVSKHLKMDVTDLRGKDLMCWCAEDAPCHADVLLKLANKNELQDIPTLASKFRVGGGEI